MKSYTVKISIACINMQDLNDNQKYRTCLKAANNTTYLCTKNMKSQIHMYEDHETPCMCITVVCAIQDKLWHPHGEATGKRSLRRGLQLHWCFLKLGGAGYIYGCSLQYYILYNTL